MKTLLLGGLCAISVGCANRRGATDIVTARIDLQFGTNRATIVQPKDTKMGKLELTERSLTVEDYMSSANAGALELEKVRAAAMNDMILQGIALGRQAGEAYLRMQGVPIPNQSGGAIPNGAGPAIQQFNVPPGFQLVPLPAPAPAAPVPIPNAGRIFDPTPGITVTNQPGRAAPQP